MKHTLRTILGKQLVSKVEFARVNHISLEVVEKIVQLMQDEYDPEKSLSCLQGHLASKEYRAALSEAIRHLLDEAVKEVRCV